MATLMEEIANYWEQNAMTCSTKGTLGIDCMGCGMQRSIIALFRGEVAESIAIYPALIPLIIMFVVLILHLIFKFEKGAKVLLVLFIINVIIILVPYLLKIYQIFF